NQKNNKVVGIAFQGAKEGTVGHSITINTIQRFFKDIEDGSYDGVPFINIKTYDLISEQVRKELKMGKEDTGVFVEELCSLDNYELQEGDIITHIDNINIANNGTIEGPFGDRVLFRYHIKNKQIGDSASLSIIRNGEKQNIDVKLGKLQTTCPGPIFNEQPVFCMKSGVCFTKLTFNYYGSDEGSYPTEERKEIVKAVNVLPIKQNKGYDWAEHKIVDEINSIKIVEFKDVLKAFETPLEKEGKKYHKIVFDNEKFIILQAGEEGDMLDKKIKEDWSINSFKSKIFEELNKQ
ncbi:MAG: PDZ domain-containing protein, partial [Elusimicrobiaceae bacterium]|nr:PDZ domain-containing protein [Elusimicrobiaceae bacterium]